MAKKVNPKDATLRNVQAGAKRDRALVARVRKLEQKIEALSEDLGTLEAAFFAAIEEEEDA